MTSPVRTSIFALLALLLAAAPAFAQQTPLFTPGNLVVSVEGCGVFGGTCTAVPNGTGTGAGNSSVNGYGDNQAAPLTLFQYAPSGAASVTFVNSLVLPQTASGANVPVSGEYGSSSEGTVLLSGPGQYLTIMGYGIGSNTFNANPNSYSAAANSALAQTGSQTGQGYTPVSRVVTLIDPYGNVNSATGLYNIFNTNNPRSAYTADGVSTVYVSGQGSGCDQTGGVFLSPLGAVNNAATAITGSDAGATTTCNSTSGLTVTAQDTREVQIYNGTLFVSVDSTSGKNDNRSMIGTLGTPPATSLFTPGTPNPYTTGPFQLTGFGNTGGTGKVTLTAATTNGVNTSGQQVNVSPENFFFASPSVMYVADSGSPKQTSATSLFGAGGLQKWVNSATNGSGTWSLAYTLYKGLNLVANTAAKSSDVSGTTGLIGLTGNVVGGVANLYATNYTISDLDPTYLYGITDTVSASTNPGTSFTQLAAAPQDSNFKGVSFAPSLPAGSATITSTPSGLAVTTTGAGCAPGTYTTPVTLIWTPGVSCQLSVTAMQVSVGSNYTFSQWQDGSASTTDYVTAPSTSAVYTATFAGTITSTPAISVPSGSYTSAQSVSLSDTTPGATIYYTTDGSTPSSASTQYGGTPITVSTSETLNAIAVGAGDSSSAVASATYTIAPPTATTVASSSYPSLVGQTVTFTATVTSSGVAPTGTVQFSVNGTALGSPMTLNSSGSASVSTSSLPPGYLTIGASYTPGNGAFLQTSVGTFTQSVLSSAQQSDYVFFNNSVRTLGSGFNHPYGTAVDGSGNVFVADSGNAAVKEIVAAGGYTLVNSLGSGFSYPTGLAIDASGNLFVADPGNNTVYELPAAGGYAAATNLGRGFNSPYGVAVDGNDNLFVADTGNSAVKEMSPCGSCGGGYGAASSLGSGFQYPWNLAVDGSGNVFVTDIGARTLSEITAASQYSTVNTVGSGFFGNPYGVAGDSHGDLFVSDLTYGTVREISAVDGFSTVSTPSYGLNLPIGVAVDGSGNLFVADTYNNVVKEISQKGGNFGSVTIGSTPPLISMVFYFHQSTTLGSTAVLTQGTGGAAYSDAGTGTCAAGTAYNANATCTVDVNFAPIVAGARTGSVELLDGSGNVLALGTLQGTGVAH